MNGFIIFSIMFMTATGLENSPQSFGVYTVSQSRSVVTSAENPAPDNSPQSIGELRNGHVANLQELYYTRLVRKMAWYKIPIQVLIVQFLRITMCVPYWWCTKHAQLIMGTWPIYKKTLPTTDLNKKKKPFHLIKYLLATFIFFLSFQSVLVQYYHWYSTYVTKPKRIGTRLTHQGWMQCSTSTFHGTRPSECPFWGVSDK